MSWTYSNYNLANYGICVGICVVSFTVVVIVFYASKKGKNFVHNRVVGISEDDVDKEPDDEQEEEKKKRRCSCCPKTNEEKLLSFLFCLIGSFALGLAGVLIFQSCVLANTRVLPDTACPDQPMDCFIINPDANGHNAISDTVSFRCAPLNKTQFPSQFSTATAQCFGWVISSQTTKNILDQLGVCTGLLGLFSTLLAIAVCIEQRVVGITLAILFLLACVAGIILVAYFKVSFAPLTYAVLSLGIAIGIFGIIYHIIISRMKNRRITDKSETQPMNSAQPNTKGPVFTTSKPPTHW